MWKHDLLTVVCVWVKTGGNAMWEKSREWMCCVSSSRTSRGNTLFQKENTNMPRRGGGGGSTPGFNLLAEELLVLAPTSRIFHTTPNWKLWGTECLLRTEHALRVCACARARVRVRAWRGVLKQKTIRSWFRENSSSLKKGCGWNVKSNTWPPSSRDMVVNLYIYIYFVYNIYIYWYIYIAKIPVSQSASLFRLVCSLASNHARTKKKKKNCEVWGEEVGKKQSTW